ncbi:hypothetical protein BGZ63DRAFT_497163 [Mariannaea sp. PMI_226]|nr:hypothetical protein BGZ63DRAFT_497163 [Mariannaea sp. PMI_226]
MAFRSKATFYLEKKMPAPTNKVLPIYLNRHPKADYLPFGSSETVWTGQHRDWRIRQLVTVQQLKRIALSELSRLAQITHDNIAQPVALYHINNTLYIVNEHIDLDLFDLCPLSQWEVSSVMKQIISAFQYLKQNSVSFLIHSICLDVDGAVKIVFDWSYEPNADVVYQEANEEYLMVYLKEVMESLGRSVSRWSSDGAAFLAMRCLPDESHPFIANAPGQSILRAPARFAMRKKMLAQNL